MPTVPHVLAADVRGIDGRLLLVLTDTASLWVIGRDMAQVQLDLAGVEALQRLLGEVAAAMRVADAGAAAGVAGAMPDSVPSSAYKSTA